MKLYNHPIIIAFEGIDGAGKTTLINRIRKNYKDRIAIYRRTQKGKIVDRLVASSFMQKNEVLQIPIYLFLSYKNYFRFRQYLNADIIIMDRCFLSNICYFFPSALSDEKLFKKIMALEIKLFPQKIYILDVDPEVGRTRDSYKKSLNWLRKTRDAYLAAENSVIRNYVDISVLSSELTICQKQNVIISYIDRSLKK